MLVNLDDAYQVVGIWQLSVDKARSIFAHREKYRKWQVTQDRFKREWSSQDLVDSSPAPRRGPTNVQEANGQRRSGRL